MTDLNNTTGVIGDMFVDGFGGDAIIAGILVVFILTFVAIKFRANLFDFALIVIGPMIITLSRFGTLPRWAEPLVYIAWASIAFLGLKILIFRES